MTNQPTMEQVLDLVNFKQYYDGSWYVVDVKGDVVGSVGGDVVGCVFGNVYGSVGGNVRGSVGGYVCGNVEGSVGGNVEGNVEGNVGGYVTGTINGKEWQYIETPAEKLRRLIEENGNTEMIQALNDLENN